jgi:Alginate export
LLSNGFWRRPFRREELCRTGLFAYDTEFDGQTGSLGASSIAAWAGYAGVGKTFRKVAAAPRVFLEGNYGSGTKNPAGRDWNTFDQLYPSNHDKFGFADEVGRRNLVQFRTGVEEEPTRKWKLRLKVGLESLCFLLGTAVHQSIVRIPTPPSISVAGVVCFAVAGVRFRMSAL